MIIHLISVCCTYFIAIKKNEGNPLDSLILSSYTPLLPPQGRYYADPFLLKYEGINYLFFENYDYKKGVISYVQIDPEGHFTEPKLALELPTHLSFPFVFQEENEIYMIPETYQRRSVSLYKCKTFPNQWEWCRSLIHGERFSDPILFKHGGLYWLFTAIRGDQLCIYYAESLDAKFRPHPINHRHIRGRNAGPVFLQSGRLIRPTMDCREYYGKAVILKEILLLTTEEFVEREVLYIGPDWAPNLVGTHSFCLNPDYLAYDGNFYQ